MKYLIISSSRTGSNYLANLVDSLLSAPSLFLNEPFQTPTFDNTLFEKINQSNNLILKTHLNQLYKLPREHVDYFLYNNFYIILLLRKNLFDCTFSAVVADAIDNHNDKNYVPVQLSIDSTLFLSKLRFKIEFWEKFAELKQKEIHKKIVYFEDLTFNPLNDAALFLKKINFRKTAKFPSRTPYDLIDVQNKDELKILFYERIKNYSHAHIKNNNGIFELL